MEWTDAEAVARTKKGDMEAFRWLVEKHSRVVYRLAYRMTGNEVDAEDLVQETFLRAFQQVQRFDGRASFSTWLYRICSNCSMDFMRARTARSRKEEGSASKPAGWSRSDFLASPDPSPERLMLSSQLHDLLEPAMRQLSDSERTAFVLRHFDGCDIPEIANALGIRGNAAKHTVFRAVQKLRRALEPVWGVRR